MSDYVISETDRQALMTQMTAYRDLIGWAEKVVHRFAADADQEQRLNASVSVHKAALAGVTTINMRKLEDVVPEQIELPDFPVPTDFIPQEGAVSENQTTNNEGDEL